MQQQRISFSGSASIDSALDLGDHVVFVVVGKVKKETRTETEANGVVDGRGVVVHEVRLLEGLEAIQAEAEVIEAAGSADADAVLAGRPANVNDDGEYFDPEAD